ncbi:glycosyl hydrolase, partial [Streptomyces sp. NPDC006324]
MTLGLTTGAWGREASAPGGGAEPKAAAQTLTWTAGDGIDKYVTQPTTAVAGPATIVFENSAATGNTTGMPHTLTFDVSDPEYNNDVPLNILANPSDANGGKHTAEVTLTPGRYLFKCTIPGHSSWSREATVRPASAGWRSTLP